MPKKTNKRKFKPIISRKKRVDGKRIQTEPIYNSERDMQISGKPKFKTVPKIKSFTGHILSFIATFYLSLVGENMLLSLRPTLGFILPIIVLSLWLVYLVWRLNLKLYLRLVIGVLLVVVTWASMPLYIDHLPELGKSTLEFEQPYFDSTNVTVHYGTRLDDFFWTDKIIGELKQKTSVALNINGEDIFRIHTDGRQIIVDARLFAGYIKGSEEGYHPIGSPDNFSIEISGYVNTDGRPNKFYARKSGAFELKVDPVTNGTITATLLGQPLITHKYFANPVTITNGALDRKITGWDIRSSQIGFEVINEHDVPVLLLEYKEPFQIKISGLFLTSLGILKVDNNDSTIFEFGDSPLQLGNYKINRIKPRTFSDLFNTVRTYNLHEIYRVR